jgi:hypothetical protein
MNEIILIGKNEYRELHQKLEQLQSTLKANEPKPQPDYITTADFRRLFGISKVTQWKLRKAGKLPYRMIGKSILYSLREIDEVTTK